MKLLLAIRSTVTRSIEYQYNLNSLVKIADTIILVVLTFLAISSGITKVMLMPRDVDFFGQYGFSGTILVIYGTVQLIGGFLLPFSKTAFFLPFKAGSLLPGSRAAHPGEYTYM